MSCINSVTTNTGTFTFHKESLTRCEAENRCLKRGEILAPVTNKEDADALVKLFESNVGKQDCTFATPYGWSYWLGLDITYSGNRQDKVFSNGVSWNDKVHGKIYNDYLKKKHTGCPMVVFQTWFPLGAFNIVTESSSCRVRKIARYVCFKPKDNNSAEHITADEGGLKNELTLPTGVVFAVAATAVLMVAVAVFAFVRLHNKNKRLAEENKVFLMENTVEMEVA